MPGPPTSMSGQPACFGTSTSATPTSETAGRMARPQRTSYCKLPKSDGAAKTAPQGGDFFRLPPPKSLVPQSVAMQNMQLKFPDSVYALSVSATGGFYEAEGYHRGTHHRRGHGGSADYER